MDKPYDIITEIKSENEVKVTGKGPTNYHTTSVDVGRPDSRWIPG